MLHLSLIALVLVLPTFFGDAVAGGWLWDTGNGLGFAAIAILLGLGLDHGRGRAYDRHRAFGWAAFSLASMHTVYFLIADPLVIEYLKLSAPVPMLAGLTALAALLGVVLTSGHGVRRALYPSGAFRKEHWWLSAIVAATAGWHVVGSGFYYDTWLGAGTFIALLIVLTIWPRTASEPIEASSATRTALKHSAGTTLLILVLFVVPRNLGVA
ncbi:MAG: ferric reductase-like transmembrane domain-containing protein [Pseudomonadales bacterium]|nr:ferric reductase-like transmembrane domain-containing protein [Pseudomonadales bacterium]MDP6470645.1 ferric reductase-like transmembrane domain-containing protein [Pseudomonadales bacterium]MDP6828499.1 ferric reductase-like transmembrane domain-containing protein [Pseudomonadales bacterium]MDP6970516.1 ferric reductase-like transmembrane domain-containing protein [Pseudomonadales bacterium]